MKWFRLRPNRNAFALAAILLAMWYAAASQSNSAVYLLGFVLASMAAVSIVHAWANLQGVALSAKPIAPVFLGEDLGVPLVAASLKRRRHGHAGLRVMSTASKQPALFDEIDFDSPQDAVLWMRTWKRGRFDSIPVQLSTIYPLGLVTAMRPEQIEQLHFVYPKPDGDLPLPHSQEPSKQPRGGTQSEGDDFYGTRSYRQGESQRHIDWKAAARGQPLLIKEWAGDNNKIVLLDWSTLGALPWEARLSQLTRWVIQAEQSGLTYTLVLPAQEVRASETALPPVIQTGHGLAHFHECLRALASFPPDPSGRVELLPERMAPASLPEEARRRHSAVSTESLAAISGGLLLGALPLFEHISPWIAMVFLISMFLRLFINVKRLRLPSMPVKLVLLGAGLSMIGLIHGSMFGVEPGMGILFILLALKLLETNTVHDFQVLAMLGWFVALCGLFFSQDLRTWLYVGTVGMILTAALIHFHRNPRPQELQGLAQGSRRLKGTRHFGVSIRPAGTMLLQALPLTLLFFLFFPRTYGGYQFTFSNGITSHRAMSEQMEPGSVAALALSDAPVFRVEFPDRNMPLTSQLYWRGGVLWRGDGLTWVRGGPMRLESGLGQLSGPAIRQQIIMEPHGDRWIFALDRPAEAVPKTSLEPGGYLQSSKLVNKALRYEVRSRPENRETRLLPEHFRAAVQKPAHISPRVQALVASWMKGGENDRAVMAKALKFFRTENFSYTLTPGRYSGDALDQFLFERRTGFCEHYAGAFASLMRIAGIPARVVIGFHGGEFNTLGKYVIVRQCDAHAWCEVWMKEQGWLRVDLVDAIAPGRIQSGLTSFLEARASENDPQNQNDPITFASQFLSSLRLTWDSLNYQWDLRVLSFDEESQRALFSFLGFGEPGWPSILPWSILVLGIFLVALSFWMRRAGPSTPEDPAVREYKRFCKMLADSGLPRPVYEGAHEFAERAASHFPDHGALIRKIGSLYVQLRYAKTAPVLADFLAQVKAFRKVKLQGMANGTGLL